MEFHGWIRLGLRVSKVHRNQWRIFRQWKTSYYGTSPNLLLPILRNRFVPFDGDALLEETKFKSGHPDPDYCTTCPSLAHASQRKFCSSSKYTARDKNNYYIRVVLQCKQHSDRIEVNEDMKSPERIEWKTKARSSVVPFGLLIRLQKN